MIIFAPSFCTITFHNLKMTTPKILLSLLAVLGAWQGLCAQEPYAVYDEGHTLTFYYDNERDDRPGTQFNLPWEEGSYPEWNSYGQEGEAPARRAKAYWVPEITNVVFDPSFANYDEFTSTKYMFAKMYWLTSIVGLEYLNTENVTDMSYMFLECYNLKTLDLTNFNTGNVSDMTNMFSGCQSLNTIFCNDKWDTSKDLILNSWGMFAECYELPYHDEDTNVLYAKPTTDGGNFTKREAYAVVSDGNLTFFLDGNKPASGSYGINRNGEGSWKTATFTSVTFDATFENFAFTSTNNMFSGLTSLTTIHGLTYLNTSRVADMSNMFSGCTALSAIYCNNDWSGLEVTSTGMFSGCANLPEYNAGNVDAAYAKPGAYFSTHEVPYAVLTDKGVLSFYYDENKESQTGVIYGLPWVGAYPAWKPELDEMARNVNPTRSKDKYIPIKKVVFDPSFGNFDGLKTTKNMFAGLSELTSIEGLEYLNTQNVTDMSGMFYATGLTSLDLTSLNTENVTDMSGMFLCCYSLAEILCNDDWYKAGRNMDDIFGDCELLAGDNGTAFSVSLETGGGYAHPDGGTEDPGYFSFVSDITLYDSGVDAPDNKNVIRDNNGHRAKVTLSGRILYKDDTWNTLCLPFSLNSLEGTPLEGATLMTLSETNTSFSGGELTLSFETASSIEAGMPYLIKWEDGDDIVEPTFKNVKIDSTLQNVETEFVDFGGNYDPVSFTEPDPTALYLGAGDMLYYPNGTMTIGAFRAYFVLKGLTAGPGANQVRAINLNFDEQENGIKEISSPSNPSNYYFTLDGRKLTKQPTARGIYVKNGKKVMIK